MDADLERWKSDGRYFDFLGFDVFYRVEGQGPPLLLIHGYPFNSYDWAMIWPTLTQRFTVIAPDMLGMGFSDKPVNYRYSVSDHADAHEALLEALGVQSCHVLAHDLGVSVGQELLARHEVGDWTHRGVTLESITWLNGGLFIEAYAPRTLQKLLSGTPLGSILSPLHGSPLSRRLLNGTLDELFGKNAKPTRAQLDVFHQILDYNDGKRVLHAVGRFVADRYAHRNRWVRAMRETGVPMRLIDGPADPNSGRHLADRYREVIPNADVVLLADEVSHWPQLEVPDAVLEHFLAHVDAVLAR